MSFVRQLELLLVSLRPHQWTKNLVVLAALIFAPAGELVPVALRAVRPGGTVSLAGIHMSRIPAFDYAHLWHERSLRSVANMTRADAVELMALAATAGIRAQVQRFSLDEANDVLLAMQGDRVSGTAVLEVR